MLSNRAHLAIVFLLSAIGGGILSLVSQPDGISVGASGGIVGLIGYLAVYAFRRRQCTYFKHPYCIKSDCEHRFSYTGYFNYLCNQLTHLDDS